MSSSLARVIQIDNYYTSFMSQEIDQGRLDIYVTIVGRSVNLSGYNRGCATFRYQGILGQSCTVYRLSIVVRFIRMQLRNGK